jgi:hypothetical protein
MPTLKEFQQIAFAIREILEEYSKGATTNVVFNKFPEGACGGAADLLGYYFIEALGLDAEYLVGYLPNGDSHAWTLVDGIIVDITADQFGNEPVIVSQKSEWHEKLNPEPPCSIRTRGEWTSEYFRPWNAIIEGMRKRGFPS